MYPVQRCTSSAVKNSGMFVDDQSVLLLLFGYLKILFILSQVLLDFRIMIVDKKILQAMSGFDNITCKRIAF